MSSKKHKGSHSKSSASFNSKRFVSAEAEEIYNRFVEKRKSMIMERGLRPNEDLNKDGMMADFIIQRRWHSFTDIPDPAVIPLVREFYANASIKRKNNVVFVRGKMVSFAPETINAYYGLESIEDDDYTTYLSEDLDYSDIMEKMCAPGTEWTSPKDDPNIALSFPENTLNRYAKAWNKFICANFMPTTHQHEISKERAALLFCICTGRSIDVGKVIRDSLLHSIRAQTTGGHTHPCLITALCRDAGVKISKDEPTADPDALIDHKLISRYACWNGGESAPSGLGFLITRDQQVPPPRRLLGRRRRLPGDFEGFDARCFEAEMQRKNLADNLRAQEHQGAGTSQPPRGALPQLSSTEFQRIILNQGEQIVGINTELGQYRRDITDIQGRVSDLQQRQLTRSTFEANYFNTLGLMMNRMSLNSSQDFTGIPPFPQYPESLLQPYNPHSPPQGDDDEASNRR